MAPVTGTLARALGVFALLPGFLGTGAVGAAAVRQGSFLQMARRAEAGGRDRSRSRDRAGVVVGVAILLFFLVRYARGKLKDKEADSAM